MPEKVRILCVGIGGYANEYIGALLDSGRDDFQITGAVDVRPESCRRLGELRERGAKLYGSMEEFFSAEGCDSVDLTVITTPIHLHTRQIICALRHGSNVLCEKPLSGVSSDAEMIEAERSRAGRFVMIGYQMCFSPAIAALKADVLSGAYGRPLFLKTLALFPHDKAYFLRSPGWAGRIRASDGTVVNDSVVANATSHYLNNLLWVTGPSPAASAEAAEITSCRLYRLNKIENFDTAVFRMKLDNGADCLYIASHDTDKFCGPRIEYRFERGKVSYSGFGGHFTGSFSDGTVRDYGDPLDMTTGKVFRAIDAVRTGELGSYCSVGTAASAVRCVELIQRFPIEDYPESVVREKDGALYVEGLYDELRRLYETEGNI